MSQARAAQSPDMPRPAHDGNYAPRSPCSPEVSKQTFSSPVTPLKRKAKPPELFVPSPACEQGNTKAHAVAKRVTRVSGQHSTAKKFGVDTHATVAIPRDGDCFFNCLRQAFSLTGLDISERLARHATNMDEKDDCLVMRDICADHLTSEVFELYSCLSTSNHEEYGFMKKARINNLSRLKEEMRKPGKIWAREVDMNHLAKILNITILLYDERFESKIRFPRDMSQGEYYIVMKRDKQGIHYNLIKFPWSSETNTVCVPKQKKAQEWICLFLPNEIPRDILGFFGTLL